MNFEFCRCLLNSEFPIQNWIIQHRLCRQFNIPHSTFHIFFLSPEGKITPCRGCNLQICITLAKLIHSRGKHNSCCVRRGCLLCVMCKGGVDVTMSRCHDVIFKKCGFGPLYNYILKSLLSKEKILDMI